MLLHPLGEDLSGQVKDYVICIHACMFKRIPKHAPQIPLCLLSVLCCSSEDNFLLMKHILKV